MRFIASILILFCTLFNASAQNKALFILEVSPEARASGMGDTGLATSPDAAAQRWNAAKFIFAPDDGGVSISYTPWLSELGGGMNLAYLSGYYRPAERSAIGASVTYFSIGDISLSSLNADFLGIISAQEYAFDVSYSHKLTDKLSGGIAIRFASALSIESTGTGGDVIGNAPAFAGDVNLFYTTPLNNSNIAVGMSLFNLGSKVKISSYDERFLPMTLGLGASWNKDFNNRNGLAVNFDVNKSLVPNESAINLSTLDAVGKSFGNGDDLGFCAGVEYSFVKTLMLRAGYRGSQNNSSYRYATLGAGIQYNLFSLNMSYLLSTSKVSSAMSNTFRFTFSYAFGRKSETQQL